MAIGALARRIFEANGWRRLGYASELQYGRERVGCSVASLRARITLSRRSKRLPGVTEAVVAGEVRYEAAARVARVSTSKTVDAWLARATQRTVRHLREEVEVIEMIARATGDPGVLEYGPPDDELFAAAKDLERTVLSGKVFQMSGGPEPPPARDDDDREPSTERLRPGAGHVTLRLRLTEETYWHWKAVEKAFRRSRVAGTFVGFLCATFHWTWGSLGKRHAGSQAALLRRDLYRCTNPVCGGREVEDHHIVFRSRGGSDALENRTCLCPRCHHRGVHEGKLRATPPAPGITWLIGRDPILRVEGRKKSAIP
jgi:HNH endonuclease